MKRTRNPNRSRMSRDSERLVGLALGLNASGSRLEDGFWERELGVLLSKLLKAGNDTAIDSAIDHLFSTNPTAYDVLVDQCEAMAESLAITQGDAAFDVLLVAMPILAWTRYAIPSGPLAPADAETLRIHLGAHILAADVRVALAPYLFSIDQMPHSFSETHALARKLGQAALNGTMPRLDMVEAPETAPMLADPRFLLAGVAVARGRPMFRWQEHADAPSEHVGRAQCLEQWITQGRPNIAPLLPGCGFELLLPDAFYFSFRDSDRRIRAHSIRAGIAFLENALKVQPAQLRAVLAGVGDEHVDEIRVGLTLKGQNDVVHGVVWPLYGREDADREDESSPKGGPPEEIATLLKEVGVTEIRKLPGLHFPEFCEDCGAPFFPDPHGDFVHAELPDEGESAPAHFH